MGFGSGSRSYFRYRHRQNTHPTAKNYRGILAGCGVTDEPNL